MPGERPIQNRKSTGRLKNAGKWFSVDILGHAMLDMHLNRDSNYHKTLLTEYASVMAVT